MIKETKTKTSFERSAAIFVTFVCATSLLAITGWLFNLPLLASLRPEFIPMAPSTALIFLGLCGAGFIYRVYSARRGMRILVETGLVGMLIIVLVLVLKTITGLGPDFEQVLFPNPTLFGEIETARISPLTALGFFLAIPAFLLLTRRTPNLRERSASAVLSLALFILSSLMILSYIYGAPPFYGSTLIPVAVTTAFSFFFLSLGLLMTAGPDCWPVRVYTGISLKSRLMRTFIPASLVIVLLQGFFSTISAPWIANPAVKVAITVLFPMFIVINTIFLIANKLSKEIDRSDQARMKAESNLNQSEARFRTLIETVNLAVINIDRDGHIVLWNRAAETIFGYSTGEVMGKSLEMVMPEEFHIAHQHGVQHFLETGESHILGETVEIMGLRKDGHKFPLMLTLATWQVGGDVYFTGIGRDISEQREVEIALIDERNLLITLMENVPDMIYFKDAESRFIRASQAQARRFDLNDPAQIVGKTDFDFFSEEHAQAAYDDEQAIIGSGQPLVAKEEKETYLDGHITWVSTTKMPLRSQQGHIVGTFGISRDITDRKQVEEALRESEERFRGLYEKVPTGIYRTSPDGHILMANPALVRMLGYETFEELSQRNLTTENYEPEYPRQEFQKRIERDREVRGLEAAWKCKDGSIIYVRESAHLVQNENGQPVYYEGTVEDITQWKQAEEALRKSETSLQVILHSTADGILAVGNENQVLYANERFTEIWRIPPAVIASKDDGILLQHVLDQLSDPQIFLNKVQELYKSKNESFDILHFKDGRVFERLSRPLIQGDDIRGRVWSFRDVTERMHFELVQNALFRITQTAITSDGIDALYQSIHSILRELVPADNFFFALYDPASGLISFPYFMDNSDALSPAAGPIQGLTGYVIRSGRPLMATRETFNRLVHQGEVEVAETKFVNWMGVPLKVDGSIMGVMAMQCYTKTIHFDAEDLKLMEFVSTQVAQVIMRKRMEEEICSLSLTDELTGLNNRRGFILLAEQEVKQAHREKRRMLLFFGDMDNLKSINDTLGHNHGDMALIEVSAILKKSFRESDILGRIGGDEFVILAVDASMESAEFLTNRVQAALDARNPHGNETYHLNLSLGIAQYDPEAPHTVSELIALADGLMYQQKQSKKEKM